MILSEIKNLQESVDINTKIKQILQVADKDDREYVQHFAKRLNNPDSYRQARAAREIELIYQDYSAEINSNLASDVMPIAGDGSDQVFQQTPMDQIMSSGEWMNLSYNVSPEKLEGFESALAMIIMKLIPGVSPDTVNRHIMAMSNEHQGNLRSMINRSHSVKSAVAQFLNNLSSKLTRF